MPIRVPSPGHPRLCENTDPVPSFKSAEWTATTRLKQGLPYANGWARACHDCFAVVLEMPAVRAGGNIIHQMSLFRSTESTTFPTLLELPSNFIVSALLKLTGVVFHGALWLPRGFASDDG